jgi:glycosyltransferase involved in cell wall biosynthesis
MQTVSALHLQTSRKAVAMVAAYAWINISTPPLMTARYLTQRGYLVDLFMDADERIERMGLNLPKLDWEGFTVRLTPQAVAPGPEFRFASGARLPREHQAVLDAYPVPPRDYGWIIGFDPGGLVRAAALGQIWGVPYVYHSLEIADANAPDKALEACLSREALYTLTQDDLRGDILAGLNGLDRDRVFVSRNSSLGGVLPEKHRRFHERFPIRDRKVVLAAGTLLPDHCLDEIMRSVGGWPKDWVLVMHGWIPDESFKAWVSDFTAGRDDIFVSTEVVPPEEKFAIFQSADVGLIFFNPRDINMASGAGSAGKFYDCLRCGVPVIGNDLLGMRDLVETSGCGLVVRDASELPRALERIGRRLEAFRARCLDAFPEYEFSRSYAPILEHTERVLQSPDGLDAGRAWCCAS